MAPTPEMREVEFKTSVSPHRLSGIYLLPKDMEALLILSHGAGAGMNHPFMEELARSLLEEKIGTFRFNFPYMEAGRRLPGSPKHAMQAMEDAVTRVQSEFPEARVFLGGKSYGGRMSSQLMAENPVPAVKGLVFYGFPLHSPGKPSVKRAEHLNKVQLPMLFLQGSQDKLATPDLLTSVVGGLTNAEMVVFDHADHSFKRPKKVSGDSLIPSLARLTGDWIRRIG